MSSSIELAPDGKKENVLGAVESRLFMQALAECFACAFYALFRLAQKPESIFVDVN